MEGSNTKYHHVTHIILTCDTVWQLIPSLLPFSPHSKRRLRYLAHSLTLWILSDPKWIRILNVFSRCRGEHIPRRDLKVSARCERWFIKRCAGNEPLSATRRYFAMNSSAHNNSPVMEVRVFFFFFALAQTATPSACFLMNNQDFNFSQHSGF